MMNLAGNTYLDVLEALMSDDPEVSWQAYEKRMSELGCDTLLYVYVDSMNDSDESAAFEFRSTVPDQWFEHYFKENHHVYDHVYQRRTVKGVKAPLWLGSEIELPEDYVGKTYAEQSSQAGQAGFRACINYQMSNLAGKADTDVFALTIGTTGQKKDLEKSLSQNGREIKLLSQIMHMRMGYNIAQATIKPLTRREIECLTWVAAGLRVDRIAHRLGISNASVSFHLGNARQKLKSNTLPEAVAIAIRLKLLSL